MARHFTGVIRLSSQIQLVKYIELSKKSEASMTQFPHAQIAQWIKALKVEQPLESKSDRFYLDFFKGTDGIAAGLRGRDVGQKLASYITLNHESPTCQLFSGYIGTGKTTELKVLQHYLQDQKYNVLYVDFSQYHDLGHSLDIVDFCFLIAGAFSEAAAQEIGEKVEPDDLWNRFKRFLADTNIDITEANFKIPGLFDMKSTLRHGEAEFWSEIRRRLSGSIGAIKAYTRQIIDEWHAKIKNNFPESAGVVFILDSLERLRGTEMRFEEVMDSFVDLINEHHDFLQLPGCHSIITVPPYASFFGKALKREFGGQRHKALPAIKVIDRKTGKPYKDGIDAMIALLGRRIDLDAIFGTTFRPDLEKLVFNSAGHLKTALIFLETLVIDLADSDTNEIPELVNDILADFAEEANFSVRPEDVPALNQVLQSTNLDNLSRKQLYQLSRFIDSNYVLFYQNKESWFQVHPLLMESIRRRAADLPGDKAIS
jgi:hypothetical protein